MRTRSAGVVLLLLVTACRSNVGPEGKEVGGLCNAANVKDACDETCLLLGPMATPPGICSMRCATDVDCPATTACISTRFDLRTFCLPVCQNDNECAEYSRGLTCDLGPQPSGTSARVCFVPSLFL